MTAHSKVVGGSTAHRALACPGSVILSQQAPPQESSPHALRGTALHNAIEQIVLSHWGKENANLYPMDFKGVVDEETGYTITGEDCADGLGPAWDMFNFNVLMKEPRHLFTEVAVTFAPIDGSFGTVDILAQFDDRILIWDWKFGFNPVRAEENAQLLYYATAATHTPEVRGQFLISPNVELAICQPGHPVESWMTTTGRLNDFSKALVAAVAEAKPDNLHTGKHCKWCPAAPFCPKLSAVASRAVSTEVGDENLDELLSLVEVLEQWCREVKTHAHTRLEQGLRLHDWKLVKKRATRKWRDEEKAASQLLTLDVPEEEMYRKTFLSPAQAEKLAGKLPKELFVSVSSGTTLAPMADKREAVVDADGLRRLAESLNA